MSNWYRHQIYSDFYQQDYCDRLGPEYGSRHVCFVNMSQWDAVKGLSIQYHPCGDLSLQIQFGAKVNRKIRQAIINWKKLQCNTPGFEFVETTYDVIYSFVAYGIELKTMEAISQLPQLLRFINRELKEEIFSADILQEIESITACSLEMRRCGKPVHGEYHHVIPQLPHFTDCTNPHRIQSKELSELLSRNYMKGEFSDDDFGQFQSLLALGEDPDQCHPLTGRQPLDLATYFKDTEVYQFLLHYHANPFSRFFRDHSSFDLALHCGNTVIANIIMEKFSQPERPVTLMIKHIDVAYHQQKQTIQTNIDWYLAKDTKKETVASVVTEMKRTVDEREEQEIIAWSNDNFELPNDPQQLRLTESVRHDLHKGNQVIEIIRSRGKMVGFNIFEIIIPEEGNKIYFSCNWSLVGPEFRQTNMIPLLVKRPALILRWLNRDKVIVFGYLAADFNSYRLADDLHWPMYQTKDMASEARYFHHALRLRPDETYHHHGLASYVDNQAMVKKRAAAPKQNFHSRFFHRDLLDRGDTADTGYTAALVLSPVTDLFFLSLQKNCKRIGMNLEAHLQSLSYLLQEFLSGFSPRMRCLTPAVNTNYLNDARYLFWLNREVESDKVARHTSFKMRSKL